MSQQINGSKCLSEKNSILVHVVQEICHIALLSAKCNKSQLFGH